MVRNYVFSKGRLIGQEITADFLNVALYEDDVQVWVDMEAPTPEESKYILETIFKFHPLAIEDCVKASEQPKVDEYDTYFFMVIHAVDFLQSKHAFETAELNLFIGKNYLVTYHEGPLDCIAATLDRVARNTAAAAKAADRLTYGILDLLLEHYNPALHKLSDEIATLEDDVLRHSGADFMSRILDLKSQVARVRQIVGPQREIIGRLARGELKLVRSHLLPYYRDLQNRLNRISEQAENYRDSLTNMMQVYLSVQQAQTNVTIRRLTFITTIFMPLSLLAGIGGMSEWSMMTGPGNWKIAYPAFIGAMIVLGLLTYALLRRFERRAR